MLRRTKRKLLFSGSAIGAATFVAGSAAFAFLGNNGDTSIAVLNDFSVSEPQQIIAPVQEAKKVSANVIIQENAAPVVIVAKKQDRLVAEKPQDRPIKNTEKINLPKIERLSPVESASLSQRLNPPSTTYALSIPQAGFDHFSPLLLGYASADTSADTPSVFDHVIDPNEVVAPTIKPLPKDRPTQTANGTENYCSGSRWAVMDETGKVLATSGKKASIACPMASLTKVMTCHLYMKAAQANSLFNDATPIKITRSAHKYAREGHRSGLIGNGSYKAGYLATVACRKSDALATAALALKTGRALGFKGTDDQVMAKFVEEMNHEAKLMGLTNTMFTTSVGFTNSRVDGFSHTNSASTVEDMARLLMKTYENDPDGTYMILGQDSHYKRVKHSVAEISKRRASFGKSGTTDPAGISASLSFKQGGKRYYMAVFDTNGKRHRSRLIRAAQAKLKQAVQRFANQRTGNSLNKS